MVQLSYPYTTTGKNIAFTIQIFVGKEMALLVIYCLQFVTAFKEQASFNFMAAVTINSDFAAQENKICHYFHFFSLLFAMK